MAQRTLLSCDDLCYRYLVLGQAVELIANDYGYSTTTIARWLRSCGISLRHTKKATKEVSIEQLWSLYYRDQLPIGTIAKRLGVSSGTIQNRLRRYGFAPRQPIPHIRLLRKIWQRGLRIDAVANIMQVGPSAVVRAIVGAERQLVPSGAFMHESHERAYLCGLRRSWLVAERIEDSALIVVFALATEQAQFVLFEQALGLSTHPPLRLNQEYTLLSTILPGSWGFLLGSEEELPNWIISDENLLMAAIAGLIDGSGQFDPDPTAPLVIELDGRAALLQLQALLELRGYQCQLLLARPGDAAVNRWRLQVNGATSIQLRSKLYLYLHSCR